MREELELEGKVNQIEKLNKMKNKRKLDRRCSFR